MLNDFPTLLLNFKFDQSSFSKDMSVIFERTILSCPMSNFAIEKVVDQETLKEIEKS
jgi:hypothetical protein